MNTIKTVIITGANGNLGNVVTKTFLNNGYRVLATVLKEEDKEKMPLHDNLLIDTVNLTNEKETADFIENAIAKYQKIDAALLLAGGFTFGNIEVTKSEDIKRQIALNFETAYHVVQPLLQHMLDNNYGRLVLIGAKPALNIKDGKNKVAYSLSKSLLFQLAGIINETTKGKNVTATVVVPSIIDTPANRTDMPNANPSDWVQPQELADIIDFICSEKSSPIRESVIKVYNNS